MMERYLIEGFKKILIPKMEIDKKAFIFYNHSLKKKIFTMFKFIKFCKNECLDKSNEINLKPNIII